VKYELREVDGKHVFWSGDTPEDAITRYLDAHRDSPGIVAWRVADEHRHGIFALERIEGNW
jgi:hypothetical protein